MESLHQVNNFLANNALFKQFFCGKLLKYTFTFRLQELVNVPICNIFFLDAVTIFFIILCEQKTDEIVERIVNDKNAMSHFWKYKKDYPNDWKRAADNLTADRHRTALLRVKIKDLKNKMRENTVNHPQK
jgi:hypothetical protein